MFWLGVLVVLLGGLISVGVIRRSIRGRWPRVREHHLDVLVIFCLIVGLAIAVMSNWILEETLEALREYSDVAKLNIVGTTGMVQAPLVETTSISRLLEGSFLESGNRISVKCDAESVARLGAVAATEPRFPFAHAALALCLYQLKDGRWKDHARAGVKILERTTKLAGHHPHHDEMLTKLRKLLKNGITTSPGTDLFGGEVEVDLRSRQGVVAEAALRELENKA